jgi:hypothetical protein
MALSHESRTQWCVHAEAFLKEFKDLGPKLPSYSVFACFIIIIFLNQIRRNHNKSYSWECSSGVECLSSVNDALGSILSSTNTK